MRRWLNKIATRKIGARLRANILPVAIIMISVATATGTFAAFVKCGERFVSVARDASFYETLTFDEELQSINLQAALDQFAQQGPELFRFGRLIRAPGPCAGRSSPGREQQARLAGEAVIFLLAGLDEQGSPKSYYFEIYPGETGTLQAAEGQIRIDWNDCSRGSSYSLHADPGRRHFMLKEDGKPMLAWSRPDAD